MPEKTTKDEVMKIHEELVKYFLIEGDPIDPPGLRDDNLLESAISRQETSLGSVSKYTTVFQIAATIMYGICMNHPFHNGNKRTALVTAIVYLDKNGYIPDRVRKRDFYNLLINLAAHNITSAKNIPKGGKSKVRTRSSRPDPDDEVKILAGWLQGHMRKINTVEHPISFRQLRKILKKFEYYVDKCQNKGFINIYKIEKLPKGILSIIRKKKITRKKINITQVAYSTEGALVEVPTQKKIRKACRLAPEDGIDSNCFYGADVRIDRIINDYRTILKRLSRV